MQDNRKNPPPKWWGPFESLVPKWSMIRNLSDDIGVSRY